MNKYSAFNLLIKSDFFLPGYESFIKEKDRNSQLDTISIERADIALDSIRGMKNSAQEFSGAAEDLFKCRILDGKKIIVDPDPAANIDYIQVLIGGMLMAALLRQRGYLVLHGSCVADDFGAIAFIGDAGWGKSTLANFYARQGYTFISDDLLVLDLQKRSVTVLQGPASTKLWPDSGEFFTENYDAHPQVHRNTIKRMLSVNQECDTREEYSTVLKKIYVLEGIKREEYAITQLSGRDAFIELTKHTRVNKWLTEGPLIKNHFKQCASLMEIVPVSLLRRKKSLKDLREIKMLIDQDLHAEFFTTTELQN